MFSPTIYSVKCTILTSLLSRARLETLEIMERLEILDNR